METTGINKTVYRSDVISALDSFTSVRNVLAWEMFQDGQVRNYDGVINDLQRLYPDIDFDSVTENINPESIAADENTIYALVDNIINKLIESGISKDNFNYAIWACDDPENVADTYGVDIDDVSTYKITDGILLQDLGYEGQLYGVAEYPEEEWDIIESALKGGNMKTIEQYKDYYLEKLIRDYGEFTSRDYNSAKDFCYNEEWKLSEQQDRLMRKQLRAVTPEEEKIIDEKMADKGNAIEGLNDAWKEYKKRFDGGFEVMNNRQIKSGYERNADSIRKIFSSVTESDEKDRQWFEKTIENWNRSSNKDLNINYIVLDYENCEAVFSFTPLYHKDITRYGKLIMENGWYYLSIYKDSDLNNMIEENKGTDNWHLIEDFKHAYWSIHDRPQPIEWY